MALNQTQQKKVSFLVPADTHIGILYSVIDLGRHDSGFKYEDSGESIIQDRLSLTFELQDVLMDDGRPAVISKEFTASLNEKSKLRPVLVGLGLTDEQLKDEKITIGQHLKSVLGKAAYVTTEHRTSKKGNTFANLSNVTRLPSSQIKSVKKQVNPSLFVDDVDNISSDDMKKIPTFLSKKQSERIKSGQTVSSNNDIDDGEVPF